VNQPVGGLGQILGVLQFGGEFGGPDLGPRGGEAEKLARGVLVALSVVEEERVEALGCRSWAGCAACAWIDAER
jgi:hypothetical protein